MKYPIMDKLYSLIIIRQKIGTECTREQFICMDIPMEKMCCHICRTVMTFP